MPFTSIAGTFRVLGASPDGDSVRFYPDAPDAWQRAGLAARTNAAGGAQLRLDAIDALETHYSPRSGPASWHQPAGLAGAASARLLELLGFGDITRDDAGTVVAAIPEQVPGHILTRFVDKYGRPVAFAFTGDPPADPDLSQVWLDVDGLRESANHRLLSAGLVYPTFYSKLYVDLRAELAATAGAARAADEGVWEQDGTTSGFVVDSRSTLENQLVILPKLFRRLADYVSLGDPDAVDLAGFPLFLAARDDRLFTLPDGRATGLDTLVEVADQTVRLTVVPERIVFLEA